MDWAAAAGTTHDEKEEAVCHGCQFWETKTHAENDAIGAYSDEEITEMVDDIADIIFLENGGQKTDWNCYPFEYYQLFCMWRDFEKDIFEIRQKRFDALVRSFFK